MNHALLTQAGISEENCEQLDRLIDRHQELQRRAAHSVPHVICTGIYNAGKSTLLNALTGTDYFPTGDIPTTKELSTLTLEDYVYIDTPGLNAQEEDDQVAQAALRDADIILFVSNMQNGGLTLSESYWLRHLQELLGNRTEERLIFVLSQCGRLEDSEISNVEEKFRADVCSVLGYTPQTLFCIDTLIWEEGVHQDQPLLQEAGGLDALRGFVAELCAQVRHSCAQELQQDKEEAAGAVLELIGQFQTHCEAEIQRSQDKDSREKITALFQAAKKEIQQLTTQRASLWAYIGSYYVDYGTTDFTGKSESEAKRKAREKLRSYTERCISRASSALRSAERKVKNRYANTGMDSVYFEIANNSSQVLEELHAKLSQMGLSLEHPAEIQAEMDVSDLPGELSRDVWNAIGYFPSVGDYEYEIQVSDWSTTRYETGLFGWTREVKVPKYEGRAWSAMSSISSDIRKEVGDWVKQEGEHIERWYLHPFSDRVREQADKQLEEWRAGIDKVYAQRARAKEKPYREALEALAQLTMEVKSCRT